MNDYRERHDSLIDDFLANTIDDFSMTLKKFELALLNSEMTVDLISKNFDGMDMPDHLYKTSELMDRLDFLNDPAMPEYFRYEIAIQLLAERVFALNAYWKELQECAK